MAGLRWRASTALTLLTVFALCFSLQQAPGQSVKEAASAKGKSGIAAATADDAADSAATGSKSGKKKTTKKRVEKRKSKTDQTWADDSADSSNDSTASSTGNSVGSGASASGLGGQSSGTSGSSGYSSGKATVSPSKNATTTTNPRSAVTAAKKPTTTRQTSTSRANGARAGGRKSAVLDAQHPIVKQVIDVQNRNHSSVASQKGVVGTGTGLDDDGNVVIRVYTTGADNPTIPKTIENVTVLEVLTGPIAQCQGAVAVGEKTYNHPVPIGVSVYFANFCTSPSGVAAGTIGCRMTDTQNPPNHYILSSNHVLAGDAVIYPSAADAIAAANVSNGISVWPPPDVALSGNVSAFYPPNLGFGAMTVVATALGLTTPANITQPALIDEGCQLPQPAQETIGSLFAFVPYNDQTLPATPQSISTINGVTAFAPYPKPISNQVDCAIAKVAPNAVDTGTPPDGYGVPLSTTIGATLGMVVQKYGRTTGQTFGTVSAINVITGNPIQTARIPVPPTTGLAGGGAASNIYPISQIATVTFTNEIEIIPALGSASFALPGDSGALVVYKFQSNLPIVTTGTVTNDPSLDKSPTALVRAFAGTSVFCGDIAEVLFELQNNSGLPATTVLSIDSGPSSVFSSKDGKEGRGNPETATSPP